MVHQRRLVTVLFAVVLVLSAIPALAQGIHESFDVGPGGKLVVAASSTSIEVVGGGGGVEIDLNRRSDSAAEIERDYEVSMRQDGGDVVVEIKRRKKLSNWGFRRGLKLEVQVPSRYDVDLSTSGGSVEVGDLAGLIQSRTSGGSLHFGNIDGPIEGRTSGGSITVDGATDRVVVVTSGGSIKIGETDGAVDASTSGGSIRVARAGGPVQAHTSGGSIELSEVSGAIEASTSGGSIRAYLAEQPGADSKMTTSGGKVEVVLAEGIGVDVDAKASGGSVRSDVPVETAEMSRSKLVGRINGGGPVLYLRASGGSVSLRSR